MKYMLLFCGTAEHNEAWATMPEDAKTRAYQAAGLWFQTNQSKITEAYELQAGATATTVRKDEQNRAIVTDGPFAEGGEVVGGYAIVDVADLDEALSLAKSWPGGPVEVRAVVER